MVTLSVIVSAGDTLRSPRLVGLACAVLDERQDPDGKSPPSNGEPGDVGVNGGVTLPNVKVGASRGNTFTPVVIIDGRTVELCRLQGDRRGTTAGRGGRGRREPVPQAFTDGALRLRSAIDPDGSNDFLTGQPKSISSSELAMLPSPTSVSKSLWCVVIMTGSFARRRMSRPRSSTRSLASSKLRSVRALSTSGCVRGISRVA